jgi:hypothetical protein
VRTGVKRPRASPSWPGRERGTDPSLERVQAVGPCSPAPSG